MTDDEKALQASKERLLTAADELKDAVAEGRISASEAEAELDLCTVVCEVTSMAADVWADQARKGEPSQLTRQQREATLIELWPEACRRAGKPVCPIPLEMFGRFEDAITN